MQKKGVIMETFAAVTMLALDLLGFSLVLLLLATLGA